MAVSPRTAETAQAFVLAGGNRRAGLPARDARPAKIETRTAGDLVGRPDLSDDAVVSAIAERMAFEGRDATKAAAVLKAAFAGRPVAAAFLRRLVLPAPRSALAMPTQAILREPAGDDARGRSWLKRLSPGR